MRDEQISGTKPLGLSIKQTAELTGESPWTVKDKLRRGTYRAKKSGRRTIIIYASVERAWENLPDATYAPKRNKRNETHTAV
jgi:hypothetical protein